jgi:hypothetical protein
VRIQSEAPQNHHEQRRAAHAVDIVVAKKDDAFAAINRAQDPSHGGGHIRQEEWIAQGAEARL